MAIIGVSVNPNGAKRQGRRASWVIGPEKSMPELPEYKSGTAITALNRRAAIKEGRILRKLRRNIDNKCKIQARLMIELLPSIMMREIRRG